MHRHCFPALFVVALLVSSCGIRLTGAGHVNVTVKVWSDLSASTGGIHLTSDGAADVPSKIKEIFSLGVPPGQPVDLVFVVDTTGSMGDDIDAVKADMRSILATLTEANPDRRIGLVAYRDRGDEYVSKTVLTLTQDDEAIVSSIDSLTVDGGGDLREHVYAGIDTALVEQPWRSTASQHIVLMGDAPPHDDYSDDARTYESVVSRATTPPLAVSIHTIGLYCDAVCPGLIMMGL